MIGLIEPRHRLSVRVNDTSNLDESRLMPTLASILHAIGQCVPIVFAVGLMVAGQLAMAAPTRPNVIVVMTDDLDNYTPCTCMESCQNPTKTL